MSRSGIYLLEFGGIYRYVGQSVDIDARAQQHVDSLLDGKAAHKLQMAHLNYGLPVITVLTLCHKDHLDALEAYYIDVFWDENSLNTVKPQRTIPFADDELIALLQESTYTICGHLQNTRDLYQEQSEVVEDLRATVEELSTLRSQEELAKDISGRISSLEASLEEEIENVKHYKEWIDKAVKLPWYKKMFLKAPE